MNDEAKPAAFDAFDRLIANVADYCHSNDDMWVECLSRDATLYLQAFDAVDWARLRHALFESDRSSDWKDFCCRALGDGPVPQAWSLLIDGLEHGDENLLVLCADNLADRPIDGSVPIPPSAVEAVRRVSEGASREGNRFAAAVFLNRIGAR
jgi:hypothetical protein